MQHAKHELSSAVAFLGRPAQPLRCAGQGGPGSPLRGATEQLQAFAIMAFGWVERLLCVVGFSSLWTLNDIGDFRLGRSRLVANRPGQDADSQYQGEDAAPHGQYQEAIMSGEP
ncbi:hypothetical protein [Halochromatium glycolicum]|uniref:hypothetical protein n=1 Tax=Halochromatium glycolicum TaxID=85075 RepID=UPI00190A9171|nr:hypothetical protein [Halochromatium glycolicum]